MRYCLEEEAAGWFDSADHFDDDVGAGHQLIRVDREEGGINRQLGAELAGAADGDADEFEGGAHARGWAASHRLYSAKVPAVTLTMLSSASLKIVLLRVRLHAVNLIARSATPAATTTAWIRTLPRADIARRFGRVQALDGVSLAVEEGEFFGLLEQVLVGCDEVGDRRGDLDPLHGRARRIGRGQRRRGRRGARGQ